MLEYTQVQAIVTVASFNLLQYFITYIIYYYLHYFMLFNHSIQVFMLAINTKRTHMYAMLCYVCHTYVCYMCVHIYTYMEY